MTTGRDESAKVIEGYGRLLKEYIMKRDEMAEKLGSDPLGLRYIVSTGAKCIGHVFNFALATSNDVELATRLGRKAVYYYLEFISQIGEDDHQYLRLTPRDAVLFVYKKTIDDESARYNPPGEYDDGALSSCLSLLTQTVAVLDNSALINCAIDEISSVMLEQYSSISTAQTGWICHFLAQLENAKVFDRKALIVIIKMILSGSSPLLSTAQAGEIISTHKQSGKPSLSDCVTRIVGAS